MAKRIILKQDFEGHRKGKTILVTDSKVRQMTKDKILFSNRIVAGTSVRSIDFEQMEKPKEVKVKKK